MFYATLTTPTQSPCYAIFERGEFHSFSTDTAQARMDCGTPDFTWVALSPGQQSKLVLDGDGVYNAKARLVGNKCRIYQY